MFYPFINCTRWTCIISTTKIIHYLMPLYVSHLFILLFFQSSLLVYVFISILQKHGLVSYVNKECIKISFYCIISFTSHLLYLFITNFNTLQFLCFSITTCFSIFCSFFLDIHPTSKTESPGFSFLSIPFLKTRRY